MLFPLTHLCTLLSVLAVGSIADHHLGSSQKRRDGSWGYNFQMDDGSFSQVKTDGKGGFHYSSGVGKNIEDQQAVASSYNQQQQQQPMRYPEPVQNPQKFYSRPSKPKAPSLLYQNPSTSGPVAVDAPSVAINQAANAQPLPIMMPMDASFSFGFDAGQSSRQEQADPSGFVRGQYRYVNQEGNEILVTYSAGANQGFVIENAEELSNYISKANIDAANTPKPASYQQQQQSSLPVFYQLPEVGSNMVLRQKYAFGYSGQEVGHNQESDEQGNVRGSYTTLDANGNPMIVRYSAGANKGFVIENLDEVLLRSVPTGDQSHAVHTIQPTNVYKQQGQRQQDNIAAAIQPSNVYNYEYQQEPTGFSNAAEPLRISSHSSLIGYNANQYKHEQAKTMKVVKKPRIPPVLRKKDRSYSFGFNDQSGGRQEVAESDGTVRGQYSYVNAEGNQIVVRYSASPDGGFVIENQDELASAVQKATLDGARSAAAFRTGQHRKEAELRFRKQQQSVHGIQEPSAPAANTRRIMRIKKKKRPTGDNRPSASYSLSGIIGGRDESSSSATFTAYPKGLNTRTQTSRRRMIVKKRRRPENAGYENQQAYSVNAKSMKPMDASYDFSVSSGDHFHEETSDQSGERTGSYSYVTPEGRTVHVKYRAGRNGFQILNPEDVYSGL